MLETTGGIGQAKLHYKILIKPISFVESDFLCFAFSNLYLVESGNNVKLQKPASLAQSVKCLSNQKDWISVFNSNRIQPLTVNIISQFSFYFFYK